MSEHFYVATTGELAEGTPKFWFPLADWVREFLRSSKNGRASLKSIAAAMANSPLFDIFTQRSATVRALIGFGALRRIESAPRVDVPPAEKRCIECRVMKPRPEFYRHHGARDGLQSRCRDCDNANRSARSRNEIVPAARVHEHNVATSRLRVRPRVGAYVYEGVCGGPLLAGYVSDAWFAEERKAS